MCRTIPTCNWADTMAVASSGSMKAAALPMRATAPSYISAVYEVGKRNDGALLELRDAVGFEERVEVGFDFVKAGYRSRLKMYP